MEKDYRLIRDLDSYVRLRAKKDTAITLKLKAKIAERITCWHSRNLKSLDVLRLLSEKHLTFQRNHI